MERTTNIAFCLNCGGEENYRVHSCRAEATIRGITFSYVKSRAHCAVCGEEVYIPIINDLNAQAREDAFRKAAGLITVDEIQRILKKYNIGAGPLAKALGFGEITINRYMSGHLPSKQNSDTLLEVLGSHKVMEQFLEANREAVGSVAYLKCRAELDKLNELYGSKKIEVVIRYLLRKVSDVTPLALQKMLYYAQSFYYALFGTELFTDPCQAWAHGPVYPDVYYKYREYGYDPIEAPTLDSDETTGELTIRETEFLNSIIAAFGCYSGTVLRKMTHSERPWQNARAGLLPEDRCVTEIDRADIHAYFSQVIEKYQIINPCDIKKYSEAMCENIV